MKKFTVLFLAGLLILAFGATAYAQAPKLEFRASGFIDAQTFYGKNVPAYQIGTPQANPAFWGTAFGLGGPNLYGMVNPGFATSGGAGLGGAGFNKIDSHWESRGHLKFDAVMGPNLSGTFFFEIDSVRWGSPWTSGAGVGREANTFGGWTTDRTAVEVKNIYIDVGLPYFGIPVPMTMRIGAQTLVLRPNMLLANDGIGITGGIKIDPVMIAPIYAKMLENNDFQDDDCDVWGLHVNAKLGTFTVGGYGLYYRMNSYPLWVTQPTGITGFPATFSPIAGGSDKSHMWWLGAYVDGKAGPVNINFDFVYDTGHVQKGPNFTGPRPPDVTYQGWAARGKIDYPWEKFAFGAVGMYATGPDANKTSTGGLPGELTAAGTLASKNSGYVVPPGSEQGPANGESIVVYSMEGAATGGYGIAERANYAGLSPGAFGGTWFAKLYGSVKATPWWKVTFQGLYIGDTTKHGNTLGSAFKYPGQPVTVRDLRDDKDIGWELDLINEFQIYNNLRFFVGLGYLFGGDALDVGKVVGGKGVNYSISNPWALRTRLQYTF